MNVIILAAGVGSRLYPLTKETPKCLLKIDGDNSILDHNLSIIRDLNFADRIKIVVGFEAQKIIDSVIDVEIVLNPFFRRTNSIASVWFCREFLNERVIIMNGDVCFSKEVLQMILNHNKTNFVVLDKSHKCTDADYKIVVENDLVSNMGKTIPFDNYCGEYAGITHLDKNGALCLRKKIETMMIEENYDTWYETALVELIKENGFELSYLDISGQKWAEIDTIKDLEYLKHQISR